jgi:hypothetical protein
MDSRMLIGLAMVEIEDQPVVSCFLLEVELLVGVVRNNQQLHYQAVVLQLAGTCCQNIVI